MNEPRERLGRLGALPALSELPVAELRSFVSRVEALGYSALWIGDAVSRDPFAQLAAVAEAAGRMTLGTNIVNVYGRDAMAMKMGAMTLHELVAGRSVLGLGVSHEHLVEKLRGHDYGPPLTKMRTYLEQYRSLPYKGPTITAGDGTMEEPPLLLAALRIRMTQLAATEADGALPYFVTAERVAWMRRVLDDAALPDRPRPLLAVALPVLVETDAEAARAAARAWSKPYCRAVNYRNNLAEQGFEEDDWTEPFSARLIDAIIAWGDATTVRARIEALYAVGADHVMLIPLDAAGGEARLAVLEALAPDA